MRTPSADAVFAPAAGPRRPLAEAADRPVEQSMVGGCECIHAKMV